jgi:hypothetical protein
MAAERRKTLQRQLQRQQPGRTIKRMRPDEADYYKGQLQTAGALGKPSPLQSSVTALCRLWFELLALPLPFPKLLAVAVSVPFPVQSAASASHAVAVGVAVVCGVLRPSDPIKRWPRSLVGDR